MDVKALASSLVAAEKAPQQALLDKKIAGVKAEITGYGGMMFVLSELKKKVANLDDPTDFAGLTVKNTQSAAFDVTTSASALPGQHDITVNQIAKAQRSLTATGYADNNTTVISGADFTLNVTVGTALPALPVVTSPSIRLTSFSLSGVSLTKPVTPGTFCTRWRVSLPSAISMKTYEGNFFRFVVFLTPSLISTTCSIGTTI